MLFEKEGKKLSLEEFEKLTSAKWVPYLTFPDPEIQSALVKACAKLHKKEELTLEQLWLGKYFQKEILSAHTPDVAIRWIDSNLGWGVFALRDFKKMEFIAEYSGKLIKRQKNQTAYAFEYLITHSVRSKYTIDATDQGGLSRYINHSPKANLNSSLATVDYISHVILYTKEPIAKGTQLCYDYGPDYWSKRTAPVII